MDSSDHQLSSDDMEKMFGRLDDAWRTSQWQDALTTADKLMDMVGRDGCGGVVAFKRLKAAALHALQSFSDALEGSRSTASSEMTGAPVPLATAFTALCGVFSQLLQQRGASLADALLADCSFASALLRAAATVPSRLPDFNGSAAKSKADAFAMLQVRRSAGDLLANLLDDASAALRSQRERELLMDSSEPAATLLVEAVVLSSPDPKWHALGAQQRRTKQLSNQLHEVLLQLFLRGRRAAYDYTGHYKASDTFKQRMKRSTIRKPAAVKRLESFVGCKCEDREDPILEDLCDETGDQLLDWAQELALDLNKSSAKKKTGQVVAGQTKATTPLMKRPAGQVHVDAPSPAKVKGVAKVKRNASSPTKVKGVAVAKEVSKVAAKEQAGTPTKTVTKKSSPGKGMAHATSGRDGGFGPFGGAPATARHDTINCDACGATPIVGVRYKCSQCANFDLCEPCIGRFERFELQHGPDSSDRAHRHLFLRIPDSLITAAGKPATGRATKGKVRVEPHAAVTTKSSGKVKVHAKTSKVPVKKSTLKR